MLPDIIIPSDSFSTQKFCHDFFEQYPKLYRPKNEQLFQDLVYDCDALYNLLNLIDYLRKSHLVSKKNFPLILSCGFNLSWVVEFCHQLHCINKDTLLTHSNFKKILKNSLYADGLSKTISALHYASLPQCVDQYSLDIMFEHAEKTPLIAEILTQMGDLRLQHHLTPFLLNHLITVEQPHLEALAHLLHTLRRLNLGSFLSDSGFNSILSRPSNNELLTQMLFIFEDSQMLGTLTNTQFEQLATDIEQASSVCGLVRHLSHLGKTHILECGYWDKITKNKELALILKQHLSKSDLLGQKHWFSEGLFGQIVSQPQNAHTLDHLLNQIYSVGKSHCCTADDLQKYLWVHKNNTFLPQLIDHIVAEHHEDILTAITLPRLMQAEPPVLSEIVLIFRAIQKSPLRVLTISLFENIINSAQSGTSVRPLLNYLLKNEQISLSALSYQQVIFYYKQAQTGLMVLKFLHKHYNNTPPTNIQIVSLITSQLMNVSGIQMCLSAIHRLNLLKQLDIQEFNALCQLDHALLNHLYSVIQSGVVQDNHLMTAEALKHLLKNPRIINPCHDSLIAFELYQKKVSLTPDLFQAMLLNNTITQPISRVMHIMTNLNIADVMTTEFFSKLTQDLARFQNFFLEFEHIWLFHNDIILTREEVLAILSQTSSAAERYNILCLFKNINLNGRGVSNRFYTCLLSTQLPIDCLRSTVSMLPPALLTEENVIMLMHVNERHLAHQIHPTLYNMLVSKTIDLLDQEIFRLITLSDAACNVLFQCTLLKHNFPYYRFIDSAQILRMQQNHEVALPMITFCNNTAAATGGPWITSEIFNQLFSYDEQSLIEISQICYWLSFQNRDLITYEPVGRLMSAVPFSERGLSSLFWLIFEQSYNDIITLDNFDKLMIPRSTLPKLLYDLAEQDSSRTVLSQPVFDSFVAHHEHLVRLTPYLKILNEAKAGLITATTCAEILAQGNNAALWASERVRCNSPETWLPLLPAQPSSLCAEPDFLKKMLRIYRCSDIFERGGAQHLGHNVRTLVEEFINHPEHLVWANDLAQHFLAGCVNQPVRGFSEIAAWLVVAKQTTASRRFDALRYPTILELIQKRMFEENNLLGVEVEKANALLREACSGHPLCSDWLGIPGKLAYEETITGWLNTQQKLIFEIWDTVQHMSGAMIHDFLMHTDFMLTWAPIAFPSLLADIDAQENARKEQLLELIEQACCSTLSSITPEHYSLLWPDKTATDCARLMDSFSESQTSIIDIVQSAYSSFERRLDTQKYNAVIEQTQELCDAYDENMEQRRVSHQLMMLELRQHPSLLFDSPTQDGGSSPSSVVRPF